MTGLGHYWPLGDQRDQGLNSYYTAIVAFYSLAVWIGTRLVEKRNLPAET